MVAFDGRLKSHCVKSCPQNVASSPTSTLPNRVGNSGSDSSTNILPTPLMHGKKETRIFIKTDLSQSRKIGLNVNTNVHLKPKKRYDCTHFINELFIVILTVYGIWTFFEIQRLKDEVQVLKLQSTILGESIRLQLTVMDESTKLNLELINNVINVIEDNIRGTVKIREGNETTKHLVTKRDAESVGEVGEACFNCSSNARFSRSVSRGPLALHLRGALPEITVRDGGIIAPWYIDKSSSGSFLLADGVVGERKGVLEIFEEGLYYIYAQIYYLTSSSLNSYAINVQLGDGRGREDSVVAVCSAEATIAKLSELSCFTATVRYLRRGDRLYVTQRERNRRIIFRDNQSFLGLVLLNSHHSVNNK